MLRFRRFRSRVLALLLGLLAAALGATHAFVVRTSQRNALERIAADLETGGRVFDEAIRQRIELLATAASVMARDYTVRSVLLEEQVDTETLADMLRSYTTRVNAPAIGLFGLDGRLIAQSGGAWSAEDQERFAELTRGAEVLGAGSRHGWARLRGRLHVLVVAPLYAPHPDVHAWFGLAFPIDAAFAGSIRAMTRVELTFAVAGARPDVLASTLPAPLAAAVANAAADPGIAGNARAQLLDLPAERYVAVVKSQPLIGSEAIAVVLQRPLAAELAAARELQRDLLGVSLAAFAAATLLALWVARGVSEPVRQLAEHTRHIAAGEYARRLEVRRSDEFGQLAVAFNAMSAGLAERDRVRDLLDKNVSPEIAAQLLRDGATLGGEEREVTILFADLRGFTSLSEKVTPRDLLTLLNRYLDRMSAEIERHGGVIDKFIGDGIMALFGAPVAQGDAADRALAAAIAMERALAELNREFAAEAATPALLHVPHGLAVGIGVNTARVIAGNIGSQRRLNYSVIGDGVNIAARLEALTRTPEYRTNIITSAATLAALRAPETFATRPLGPVLVKGRALPVDIFAVTSLAHAPRHATTRS